MNSFYERNKHVLPLTNAVSPSKLLDNRSRETILRNVFLQTQDQRRWQGMSLCTWVGAMTANGSGYSDQICLELGWDPDMKITKHAQLPARQNGGEQGK